jgi:hypothetical protein
MQTIEKPWKTVQTREQWRTMKKQGEKTMGTVKIADAIQPWARRAARRRAPSRQQETRQ